MNILKSILKTGVFASAACIFSACNSLDLVPIDYYGSGNYWQKPEHVVAYMDGLHKNLRDAVYQHQYVFGEARGGSSLTGSSIDGVSISYGTIKLQNLSETNYGVEKFGGLYGIIANVNIFLDNLKNADYMTDDEKSYYFGQAYGLRAFYYFDLYRVYGTVPLRLDPNPVVNGNFNPEELYMGRSEASAVMKQIKDDLDKSLQYFGDNASFDPNNRGNLKSYWSKAATECLAAEVYLWNAKVSIGDNNANIADLEIADRHLNNLMNNYGLELMPTFNEIFDVNNKGNAEIILAARFAEGEANNNPSTIYNLQTGAFRGGNFKDENGKILDMDTLQTASTSAQYNEYKKELFMTLDKEDSRRDGTFLSVYNKESMKLVGTYIRKNIGYFNPSINQRVWNGDAIIYRLPLVYLMKAEIENMRGGDVAHYINLVRQRAYGNNWDEVTFGYKNSDFTTNELAILHEKDKEFVQEGQRWWDVCRMTLTKGGEHLVFCLEGNIIGEGETAKPILNKSTETYKLLWPIEREMINKDPLLKQTPGY